MSLNNSNFVIKNGLIVNQNVSISGTLFVSGNITTTLLPSSKWVSLLTLSSSGDISSSISFDGSISNITIATTLSSSGVSVGTYNNIVVNSKGIVISGSSVTTSYIEQTGVLRVSEINLTSYGYLPLSTPSISYSYLVASYPTLSSILGTFVTSFTTPTYTGTLSIANATWYVKT